MSCITHDNYGGIERRVVFLDISKAFDKFWHDVLLWKLKQNGISGNLLKVITNFLRLRKERAVLNRKHSTWVKIEAGVPQGSILWPLSFLFYINGLSDDDVIIICEWYSSFLYNSKCWLNNNWFKQRFK